LSHSKNAKSGQQATHRPASASARNLEMYMSAGHHDLNVAATWPLEITEYMLQ
jgi:hypothetical protein